MRGEPASRQILGSKEGRGNATSFEPRARDRRPPQAKTKKGGTAVAVPPSVFAGRGSVSHVSLRAN